MQRGQFNENWTFPGFSLHLSGSGKSLVKKKAEHHGSLGGSDMDNVSCLAPIGSLALVPTHWTGTREIWLALIARNIKSVNFFFFGNLPPFPIFFYKPFSRQACEEKNKIQGICEIFHVARQVFESKSRSERAPSSVCLRLQVNVLHSLAVLLNAVFPLVMLYRGRLPHRKTKRQKQIFQTTDEKNLIQYSAD